MLNWKNVYRIELELSRTINGNLDGSIDEEQIHHILLRALAQMPVEDVVQGCHEAQVASANGQPIERYIGRLIDNELHGKVRHDN